METAALISAVALLLFTAHYVYFLTRVGLGMASLPRQPRTGERPSVSVVIAARNEERHIGACINGLLAQSYPTELLEIVVVDDRSTDRTAEIARTIAEEHPAVRLLRVDDGASVEAFGKAAALRRGIEASHGAIIATTDADCIVPSAWISGLVSYFVPGVAFVSGPVIEQPRPTIFSRLEAMEFLGLILVGAGLIGAGRPIICNGASLAFRRSAYDAVGGYGDGADANDDEGLMNKIVTRQAGCAAFAWTAEATVRTASNNTPWTFLRQRIRWASKKGRYEDGTILVTLVLLYFFFAALIAATALAVWVPLLALPVALVVIGKILMEYALLRFAGKCYSVRIPLVPFMIAQVFHVPYIVTVGALGQFVRSSWKG